ncbi:MAG TPA: SAM-dependent DNA methyltransferase [Candidatus Desulfofervidus auxilii]|uniref:site-specific DNA-methyltransferase (adenine-specific) n=1 Tax=Desulfofervidus auxilii TaxID=1621989 RepID=A0A7C2AKH8_DESA2|nr:SAM-dependent DNA methyltransferase [Candidatus Desulfofervidus auxilii]
MEIKEKIDNWLKEFLKNLNLEYKDSLTIYSKNKPFCLIEIFNPQIPPEHPLYLERTVDKVRQINSPFFITWNLKDTILWRTPKKGISISREYRLKTYFTIQQIPNVPKPVINSLIESLLKQRLTEIINDLKTLSEVGHLYQVDIDAEFFVHRLHKAVETISPLLKKSLSTQFSLKPQFKKEILAWAAKQGIANYEEESFLEVLSRQIVYRLLGKILFYETLRRHFKELPEPDFSSLDPSLILKKLSGCFEKAKHIDYQAIFEEEIIDNVPYPEKALLELQSLLDDLNRYNFSNMPQDVVGKVFEKLIPYEERHALGQYFTREDLVDFILTFCIGSKDNFILDPTCGTGTFLIRGYDRLKFLGERDHKKLLSRLWGIDIAKFPAQLATINLYRQRIEDFENFPRIISCDFFEIKEDTIFQFPPPRKDFKNHEFIKEKIPKFDCIVGNFPYIRQELIEKKVKGYKKFLEKVLAEDWLVIYPDVFELKEKDKIKDYLKNGLDISPLMEKAKLKLSGQADIYAYLFFHCGYFLKEGGRIGIVTSNAWLDVAYGYELQKFFLKNFKIIAIVESRCEPWFEDAAVNTIFTILERCSNKEERKNHLVKFVKLKKKLKELIPQNLEFPHQRWQGIEKLVSKIENSGSEFYKLEGTRFICTLKGHKTYEDDNFRIRVIKQGDLLKELESQGKTAKWGKYLRAPEIYFEILEKCRDKLVPLKEVAEVRFGIKTGINEFFYLDDEKIKKWKIEEEFLKPVIKSPKESDTILIDPQKLKYKIFICNKSKEELKKEGKSGALKYIEWGEKQKTKNGVPWPEVPSVKGRKYWYLSEERNEPIVWIMLYNPSFKTFLNKEKTLIDHTLYGISPKIDIFGETLIQFLNSSFANLQAEIIGYPQMAAGGLKTHVEDIQNFLFVPSFKLNKNIQKSFLKLLSRPIKPIFEEVKMKDRQELDSAILEALGLDPKVYLPKIYEGLCELVRERLELPKMRKKARKTKTKRDIEKLKEDVIREILPDGVKKFPEDFWDVSIKRGKFKELDLPDQPLEISQPFLGEITISSKNEFTYKTRNPSEAKYLKYAHYNGAYRVKIPVEPIFILKTVSAYERYIRDLKNRLFEAFYNRIHDQKLSHNLTQSALETLKLPEIQSK